MGASALSSLDTYMLTFPFLVILAMSLFRLDERFVTRGSKPKGRRFCEVHGEGRRFLSDPDGRPWKKYPPQQIEARIIPSHAPGTRESFLQDRCPANRRASSMP